MGMAASQARLLSITARIHDVEYQAQAIQNAKVQLATQSDKAYEDYNAALDATTLTLTAIDEKSGEKSIIAANFNNLVSMNRLSLADGSIPALLTSNNSLIVSDDIFKGYSEFTKVDSEYENNAYHFALYMLGIEQDKPSYDELRKNEYHVFKTFAEDEDKTITALYEKVLEFVKDTGSYNDIYDENLVDKDKKAEYKEALKQYQCALYKKYDYEMLNASYEGRELSLNKDEYNEKYSSAFNYYVNIYNQIQAAGGNCVPISDYNGPQGDAANNSDWLQAMVKAGKITINTVTTDSSTGDVTFNGTSPSSSSVISYTDTTTIDKKALAKAEAEYNKALKDIDKKDKQYDLSLSKLETERSALTTEYDSVKKVIEDNIERTFGIFS